MGLDSGDDFRRGLERPLRGFPIAAGGPIKSGDVNAYSGTWTENTIQSSLAITNESRQPNLLVIGNIRYIKILGIDIYHYLIHPSSVVCIRRSTSW